MKKDIFNEIDNDNLEIAEKLLCDSDKIETEGAFDQNVVYEIRNRKSKKIFGSKKIYGVASTIAACMAVVLVISNLNSNNVANTSYKAVTKSSDNNETVKVASNYEEIYERMRSTMPIDYSEDDGFSLSDIFDGLFGEAKKYTATDGALMNGASEPVYEMAPDTMTSENEGSSNKDYYDTNEQTENVHEGDVIKTDGEYIYTLITYPDMKIEITKATSGKLSEVSEIKVKTKGTYDLQLHEMYVSDNKLIILGERIDYIENNSMEKGCVVDYRGGINEETIIFIYDISDKEKPGLISENIQEGDYISSRLTEGYLYTVSTKYMNKITIDECVPRVNGKLIESEDVFLPTSIDSPEYTVLTSLNINESEEFKKEVAVAGGAQHVYVSNDNVYIIASNMIEEDISKTAEGKNELKKAKKECEFEEEGKVEISSSEKKAIKKQYENVDTEKISARRENGVYKYTDSIDIIKYNYDDGNIEFVADSKVAGYVEDNMSFDEKDGYLRFVTTESSYEAVESRVNYYDENGELLFYNLEESVGVLEGMTEETNNVFVLDEKLKTVAEIRDLAEGETVYSARYLGDYGYFVTYENTDPLFSVDFSDIRNPKIIGELKMPGFSDYLHFYTEDKLLGLGMETDEVTGDNLGVKLEMYDVSKGNAEKEAKYVMDEFDYSEALYNYKAIMVDSERGYIGFPAEDNTESYYLLYTYDNNEFKELMKISLGDYSWNVRGFYIGEYLYVVNMEKGISSFDLNSGKSVDEIKF